MSISIIFYYIVNYILLYSQLYLTVQSIISHDMVNSTLLYSQFYFTL